MPLPSVAWFQEGPGILAVDFQERGIPLIRLAGLGGHEVTLDKCNYLDPAKVERRWKHFRVDRGDILVSTSASFGRPAVVGAVAEGAIPYTGIIRFRSASPNLDQGYLKAFLGSAGFMQQAEAAASGSVISHFGPSHLKRMEIPLPPITVQQSIAGFHQTIDDKIESNRQMIETLEAIAQALFRDWFVDFGPVRRKLVGETDPVAIMGGLTPDPARAAELAGLFPAVLDGDDLPEGWVMTTLGEYAYLNPESWSSRTAPANIRYVDLSNTKWGEIESAALFNWADAPTRARRVTGRGDTLVGTVRPGNGSYAYVGVDGLTASTGFAQLRPKAIHLADLVYLASTSMENIERLSLLADGGAYPAVNPSVVLDTPVPSVPADLTVAFAAFSSPMRALIERRKAENRTLAATRDYLLPRLMSGAVRVSSVGVA